MSVVLVTGSSGLIGSEAVKFFASQGMDVVGVDNNMRQYFFGKDGSVAWKTAELLNIKNFTHKDLDIRDQGAIDQLLRHYGKSLKAIVHTAAQPSHDWAAKEPLTDFSVNAVGTINLLEATRQHSPEAVFIFTSTNKVYGDLPNFLPLVEQEHRWELDPSHPWAKHGIDESMSIDQSKHSVFGASKVAADVMVQEYGRYFGMQTGTFRGGCLTGPAHSGAELHGFLAYLAKCVVTGRKYTIFGYKGKQVRDNIHSSDLVACFWEFIQAPRAGAVYNIGGSRHSNCSMLEAIHAMEEIAGRKLEFELSNEARSGDHIWWISDVSRFQKDYPKWRYKHDIHSIISDIVNETIERDKSGNL